MKVKRILTDFNQSRWNSTNMLSVRDRINIVKRQVLDGELFHPTQDDLHQIINPERVAIKITNISLEDDNICYGDVECLDNEMGKQAQKIFDNGGRLSIRANSIGGKFTKIITWDVVNG